MLGLPTFIVGSVALGLVLVGVVPATAVGASLPIILAATSAGLFVATIWAAAIGQSAVASIFGVFAGFWLSYAVLVLGLIHGWFGITVLAAVSTQELFLISWLVIIVVLTLATLRLPLAFTAIFGLVDVALLLVLLGTEEASTGLLKTGGYVVLVFAAVGDLRLLRRGLAGHRRQGESRWASRFRADPGARGVAPPGQHGGARRTRVPPSRECRGPGPGAMSRAEGVPAGGCPFRVAGHSLPSGSMKRDTDRREPRPGTVRHGRAADGRTRGCRRGCWRTWSGPAGSSS